MTATEPQEQRKELFGGKRGSFTSETARAAALKRYDDERLRNLNESLPNALTDSKHDEYLLRRLARVRQQLDLIDESIRAELRTDTPNGQRLNWLASAQEKLAEQERQLAGRPLPGSLRPTAKQQRQNAPVLPFDPDE